MPTRSVSYASYDDLAHLIGLMTGDDKHDASATSTLDVLWALYHEVLHVDPAHPDDPDRDRFLLSKGHGPMAYYAVLAAHGFISQTELSTWGSYASRLGYHPDRALVPGVEMSSGSLGHGLPLAVGTALGLRLSGRKRPRVFVLLGDAELEEGSNSEAIEYAGRARLERLVAIVIDNRSASLGWPGGIASRFAVAEWETVDVDGHDLGALKEALGPVGRHRPLAVVAHVDPKR